MGSSQQQCEQVEQRSSDQLRNAPVLAAAAVRKSQVAKPSHQRKPIRRTQKASPDEAVAVAGENWSVIGWGVETPAMDADSITLAHGQLLQQ